MEENEKGLWPKGVDLECLGGNCPVQGEGSWRGRSIYFRARADAWALSVGASGKAMARGAGAARCNAGWMGRIEAQERMRAHLWSWSAQDRGLEDGSARGCLHAGITRLDADVVASALAQGADAGASLESGGPTPLTMALAMACDESRRCGDVGKEAGSMWSGSVHDDGRDARRLDVVKMLLARGADPNKASPGWILRPIHWAALLPSGQQCVLDWLDAGSEECRQTRKREREKENARMELNPMAALLDHGADGSLKFMDENYEKDALDLCFESRALGLAKILSGRMGLEGSKRLCWGWLGVARVEFDAAMRSDDPRGFDEFWTGDACVKLVGELASRSWSLSWLDEAPSGLESVAGKIKARALALLEFSDINDSIGTAGGLCKNSGRI